MNVYELIGSTTDNTELELLLKENKIGYYHLSWTDNSLLRIMLGNGNVVDVRQGIR